MISSIFWPCRSLNQSGRYSLSRTWYQSPIAPFPLFSYCFHYYWDHNPHDSYTFSYCRANFIVCLHIFLLWGQNVFILCCPFNSFIYLDSWETVTYSKSVITLPAFRRAEQPPHLLSGSFFLSVDGITCYIMLENWHHSFEWWFLQRKKWKYDG